MEKAPVLRSERLVLRGIREGDAPLIVAWRSDPQAYRYFRSAHAVTPEEHLRWYRESYLADENRLDWMARDAHGEPVGVFGVRRAAAEDAQAPRRGREAEVSYLLAPGQRGKGYASEAVARLIRFCADEWGCARVTAEIHEENAASIRLARRMGFALLSRDGAFGRWGRPV